MGKRNKARSLASIPYEESTVKTKKNESETHTEQEVRLDEVVVPKKQKKLETVVAINEADESKHEQTKKKKKKKSEMEDTSPEDVAVPKKQKKENTVDVVNKPSASNSGKSKKIIFVDDQPQDVPTTSEATSTIEKKKKKTFLNDDEAEVKDEDIDRFCDELGDEDNEQYENWVKLIEANFNSNKKTK